MPSFCAIGCCKLVKQIGGEISFHKFPFNNPEIFKQWVDFVVETASNDESKEKTVKRVTRYSSICSRHFLPSDFSQSEKRRFLKKSAVPSISQKRPKEGEIELVDPHSKYFCSLCRSNATSLNMMDDYYYSLVRKCLPPYVNLICLQKLCIECVRNLNMFSSFIDKVVSSQNVTVNSNFTMNEEINISNNIKLEPTTNVGEEEKLHVIDFTRRSSLMNQKYLSNTFTPQKKCEILEIIDIKPFCFDGPSLNESYEEEDDIQILSPKLMKVELTDPDEDGSNEMIRNCVLIPTVYLHDHNYVRSSLLKQGVHCVKMEEENDTSPFSVNVPQSNVFLKICHLCCRTFKTFKKYLIHKSVSHHSDKSYKSKCLRKIIYRPRKNTRIRKLCTRIIKNKKQKNDKRVQFDNSKKCVRRKKTYNCPTCQKTFLGPKNLYQHKISHNASFYPCLLCDKKFKRLHGLKQHLKAIHERDKAHVCKVCSHRYLLKADMTKCKHSKLKKFVVLNQYDSFK